MVLIFCQAQNIFIEFTVHSHNIVFDLGQHCFRIFNRRREDGLKRGIGVCSKSLSHMDDASVKFIEWIELLRALGADKIMLSVLSVHPNIKKVRGL